jgi:hypothetical protein
LLTTSGASTWICGICANLNRALREGQTLPT